MQLNINGKTIEVSNDDLKQALEENKETFELSSEDLVVRSKEDDTKYIENLRNEGQKAGIEIGHKNILRGLGIEGEGLHRASDKALEAINGFVTGKVSDELKSAQLEPNKKVEELTKDLETLRSNLGTKEQAFEDLQNQFGTYKKRQTIDSRLMELIPDNTVIPKKDVLKLMADNIKLDLNDSGQIFGVGSDGQPLKDEHLNLLQDKSIVSKYFDENPHYLTKPQGGNGGADSNGGASKQSVQDFNKEMKDAGYELNSPKFVEIMNQRIAAGKLEIEI